MSKLPQHIIDRVLTYFIVLEPKHFFKPFDDILVRDGSLLVLVDTFRNNLKSAITVGSVPYTLVQRSVYQRRFDRIHSAESIMQLQHSQPHKGLSSEQERAALSAAHIRIRKVVSDQAEQDVLQDLIISELDNSLKDGEFANIASELLRQVSVIIWSSFESLSRDLLATVLNRKPSAVRKITNTSFYRNSPIARGISFDTLESFSFDVSSVVGDIIFSEKKLDNFKSICELCTSIFSDPVLDLLLKDRQLWLLSQRRHLIVHRRGVVDKEYLEKTSDALPIGSVIENSRLDIENYLMSTREAGLAMVGQAEMLLIS